MAPKKNAKKEAEAELVEEKKVLVEFPRTDQEEQVDRLFNELEKAFRALNKLKKPDKVHAKVKEITAKLKEAKALIQAFESEARIDGMPAADVAQRKKAMAAELNGYIAMKKEFAQSEGFRTDLLSQQQGGEIEMGTEGQSMQQLMKRGRDDIKDIDKTLDRTERLVEDTKAVGTSLAGALHDQTLKLEKIVDDLGEIEFTMKKATEVIRDITRGLLTDKCIAFLLLLVVIGVVVVIVLKIINPKKVKDGAAAIISNVTDVVQNTTIGSQIASGITNVTGTVTGAVSGAVTGSPSGNRRMMLRLLAQALAFNATLP